MQYYETSDSKAIELLSPFGISQPFYAEFGEQSLKVGDGANRKAAYRGVLDASTSPPKERYAVSNDNVSKLIEPGSFDDQLTEILWQGAHWPKP
jgi:hypothetical protein